MATIQGVQRVEGDITVPGDKSISHRAVMFSALAEGTTSIEGFLPGADCLSTISCFRKLGIAIEQDGDRVQVEGKGWYGLTEPADILDIGNSGTTIRLMMGILSTQPFHSVLIGDESIARRPMKRVTGPLRQMGADIAGRQNGEYTPLSLRGGKLTGIEYHSPVSSAQIKSAVLLAGLQAEGTTTLYEPEVSRDHTERMLRSFGVEVESFTGGVRVRGGQRLVSPGRIHVPGDISSAAFPLVAAAMLPDSRIIVRNVGINPTRSGIIDVLKEMGAGLMLHNERIVNGEPVADVEVAYSSLKGIEIGGEIIPRLIDEIPVIAVLATQAEGVTVIKDAAELKVKETNRIDTVVAELRKMGAHIEPTEDGMIIHGGTPLTGAVCDSHGDHRIGMAAAVAGLAAAGETTVLNAASIDVSFPGFFATLQQISE
ncbi:3-phosphoshikimate 1-carboxyvinyltransferase [Aneurinibacillus migulanus]|uniref:3-phosphoshikimate 1-carboxyvinyltransferase n=1 Tax=Aneurinibacillus migulanus TaxID=47500 RepID=A0A0D1XXP8_ANEMI|nr:3-phosphoshikimate 1-carboxyvinyltransferase [Aneurinibacillus migulanus]KIV51862.1 3-phosphoshikimate 1-carboxyvinyltransferase [Aneurinibacillus migulanus]KON97982.1 3-phosphoshikimate 1-carboxyvinyltransferase [Aneurinibacillus migulanus]MED0891242.1 3-phosphoshikimate 1-carboxyvinyltransferase [Aneurinibacillus migulanus]MED1614070.1 3-phosphoshikimate 1-carboxyvinyltransferase [Aneurinibacillus migulanus]SDI00456.1 3-phosphoshikimate 1-carboxyvinyltransferase [Aneurinibacillus migulanu